MFSASYDYFATLEYLLIGPPFLLLLLGTGLFFTLYLGVPQLRLARRSVQLLWQAQQQASTHGGLSTLQMLATSLSGTIGVGSITGVAVALHMGGPSSLFWMWVTAILGMATRLAGVLLSHCYQERNKEGIMVGGPMYFMERRLGWYWTAHLYAFAAFICCIVATSMPQANGMAMAFTYTFHLPAAHAYYFALPMTFVVSVILLGGTKRIVQTAEHLTPVLTLGYLFLVFSVLWYHAANLPTAIRAVFADLGQGSAMQGGFLGSSISTAIYYGVNYGFYTNDAGTGAAGMAYAAAEDHDSAHTSMMAMLEPFMATCCMCTLTALAILAGNSWQEKVKQPLTSTAVTILAGDRCHADQALLQHVRGDYPLLPYEGELIIQQGRLAGHHRVTLLHQESVVEDLRVTQGGQPFTGALTVVKGLPTLTAHLSLEGKSLLPPTQLASHALSLGGTSTWRLWLLLLCLFLFGFTTTITWGYYGARAVAYMVGGRYSRAYYLLYTLCFFLGCITSPATVWKLAILGSAAMSIPNLVALLALRKEVKEYIL